MRHRQYRFRPTLRLTALLVAIMISLALWALLYVSFVLMAWMWFGCLIIFTLLGTLFYESGDFRNASWPLTIIAYTFWPLTLVGALIYLATVRATGVGKQPEAAARVSDRRT